MAIHDFALMPSDVNALKQARTDDRPEVRRKAEALLLWYDGVKLEAIAQQAGVRSTTSLYNWIQAYRDGGIDGLATHPRKGRPRLATQAYQELLEALTAMPPRALGVDLDGWTAEALNRYLEAQTGIAISDGRFRALLHDLGYRFELVRPTLPTGARLPKTPAEMQTWLDTIKAGTVAGKRTKAWQKRKPSKS